MSKMFSQEDINKINSASIKKSQEVKEVLKSEDVSAILGSLSLKWLTLGDYVVVMNNQIDATIGGEPYLALQIWLNVNSGNILCRIWDQTVAVEKVNNVKEFRDVCVSHFKRRPCIGNPQDVHVNDEFFISHFPVPRKISRSCQRVLDQGTDTAITSCSECLKLINHKSLSEITKHPSRDDTEQEIINLAEEDIMEMTEVESSCDSPQDSLPPNIEKAHEGGKQLQSCHLVNVQEIRMSNDRYKSYMKKECELCHKSIGLDSFNKHMSKQHNIEGPFYKSCEFCDKQTTTATFHYHAIQKHFFGKFLCDKCAFIGCFAQDIKEHTKKDHVEHELAKCPSCKKLQPIDDLENHYKCCIYRDRDKVSKMCETCGKILKGYSSYICHVKTHLREQTNADDLFHFCDKCDKKFASKEYLTHHVKSAHENFEYKCSSCTMIFKTHLKLASHKRSVHSSDEKYQCKFCGKRFGDVDKVKSHELIHEDAKFQCKFCPKKLKTPERLKAHERHHTGEMPFKCHICDNGFASKQSLTQHTRGVHKIAGPRSNKTGWCYGKTKAKN